MISASSAWVAAHRELLLPEMFLEIAYTVSEPGLQEDAVAAGTVQESFSTVADMVSVTEKSGGKYDTRLNPSISDPKEIFSFTVTEADARAYCERIGIRFFAKRWQDKQVIISI